MIHETLRETEDDSGFALFIVLGFLLLATAITAPFLVGARIGALVTRNTTQSTREKIMLRGLVEMAGVRFFERYQDRDFQVASRVDCPAADPGAPDVRFYFLDHSGLIDLNAADADVLETGFESLDMAPDKAAALATEVIRFRSVDAGTAAATGQKYLPGGYKHGLFEDTSELQDLMHGSGVALSDISRTFTVHSGTGTVDDAAAQGGLQERLANLTASERFFVVTDARRGNALTVKVELTRVGAQTVSSSAIVAPGQNAGEVRFVGPTSFERESGQTRPIKREPDIACAAKSRSRSRSPSEASSSIVMLVST